jgi:branched-subunit amino acid aminotransferase/4-amino-4-deoxychorismate lyase
MTIWVDGRLLPGSELPKRTGMAPFETMGARRCEVPLWDLHMARLQATAARLQIPCALPVGLKAAARQLLSANAHDDDILRCALVPRGWSTS